MGSDSGTGTCAGWGHPGREQNTAQELEYKMWEEKMDPAGDEGWEQDRAGLWGQLNQWPGCAGDKDLGWDRYRALSGR